MAPTARTGTSAEPSASRKRLSLTARFGVVAFVPALAAVALGALVIAADGGGARTAVAAVVIALVVAGAVRTVLMATRLQRSIAALQRGARKVARSTLPQAVTDIRAGKEVSTTVWPVSRHAPDEVGELARAFDAVHAEARALAVQQAGMRADYDTVFVSLSRRSQTLVQRQLRLIEQLERDQEDPDQLDALFRLDHLATRMRRNNENLMVLHGEEANRGPVQQSIALEELLRAAISEIEQYRRVALEPPPRATVHGYASGDLVRLVAELLDNATAFSAPETTVTVSAVRDPDGSVLVQVRDAGIGMRAEEIARANEGLAARHADELPASRRMGLFVVGKLAQRQGVHVALRAVDGGGLAAGVRVPRGLLAAVGASDGGLGLDFTEPAGEDTVETVLPRPAQPYDAGQRAEREPAAAPRPPNSKPKPPPERTPIFDSMRSAWFVDPRELVRGGEGAQSWAFDGTNARAHAAGERAADAAVLGGPESERWRFAADEGWQAVEHVAEAQPERYTTAGLPVRTPRARLVPGSVPGPASEQPPRRAPAPKRQSADTVRSRLSSFQHGVHRGRGAEAPGDDARAEPGTAAPAGPGQPAARAAARNGLSGPGTVPEARRPQESLPGTDAAPSDTTGSATTVAVEALTAAGLPQRRPRANLLPGSNAPPGEAAQPTRRDPQDVRSRLASFQHGLSRGRHSVDAPGRESDEHPYQWEDE